MRSRYFVRVTERVGDELNVTPIGVRGSLYPTRVHELDFPSGHVEEGMLFLVEADAAPVGGLMNIKPIALISSVAYWKVVVRFGSDSRIQVRVPAMDRQHAHEAALHKVGSMLPSSSVEYGPVLLAEPEEDHQATLLRVLANAAEEECAVPDDRFYQWLAERLAPIANLVAPLLEEH